MDRTEHGASLPEMLVALFVLAVGIAGAASMFAVAGRTVAADEHLATAERLAVSELEQLRALDTSVLGIDPSAEGYRPTFAGRPTVTETEANLVEPLGDQRVGGLDLEVRRDVTWVAVDSGGVAVERAYKLITVTVGWSDTMGPHEVSIEGPASLGSTAAGAP